MKQLIQTVYVPINGDYDTAVCNYSSGGWLHEETVIPKEGIFFTQEEYNAHIKEVIKNTLKNGVEKAKTYDADNYTTLIGDYQVDKNSILNTFEETYLKYKI
jgi:hypothetical protein